MIGFWEIYLAVFIGTATAAGFLGLVWWVALMALGRPVRMGTRESRETLGEVGHREVSSLSVSYGIEEDGSTCDVRRATGGEEQ